MNTSEMIVPANDTRIEIKVSNSRFIATAAPAFSVEEAKLFHQKIRSEYPDATHHVPAFIIGGGNSVIFHCSDDGEPSGTAGQPILAVLKGSGLGNVALVVTRYFGGTKLGTGGLVRAYSDAAKAVIRILPRARQVVTSTVKISGPYKHYDLIRRFIDQIQDVEILATDFLEIVSIVVRIRSIDMEDFQKKITNLSAGDCQYYLMKADEVTLLPLKEKG